jgi:hypothetical protein
MKSFILAGILVATTAGIANAQGVDVDVGRGGVHVGPDYRYRDRDDRRWRHRETYGFGRGDCGIVERRIGVAASVSSCVAAFAIRSRLNSPGSAGPKARLS